ncbi:Fruit bromelain [Diplonema papillatum]|nr:Fruit bromelain [Diplonema papillatum]
MARATLLLVLATAVLTFGAGGYLNREYIDTFAVKLWHEYRTGFNKDWPGKGVKGSEDYDRHLVFVKNLYQVEALEKANEPAVTMWGHTAYSDYTDAEFRAFSVGSNAAGFAPTGDDAHTAHAGDADLQGAAAAPSVFDRRRDMRVAHVKHQLGGPVSGAFAAVAAVEGTYITAAGEDAVLRALSEQWVLACAARDVCKADDSTRCSPKRVLQAIIAQGGAIPTGVDYDDDEFDLAKADCKSTSGMAVGAQVAKVVVLKNDVDFLRKWVASRGSFAASVAHPEPLQIYQEGVVKSVCQAEAPAPASIAVAIVGYGADGSGNGYWLAKNSWGSAWGEHGYVKLSMAHNCLVDPVGVEATEGVRPVSDEL